MSYGYLDVRWPQLVVYGAGGFARELCWLAESCPDVGDVVAMIDDDPAEHGSVVNGIPIHGLAEARALFPIARMAIGDATLRPTFERYTAVKGNSNEQTWLWQTERLGEAFSLGSRGGIAARHYFPLDGEYVVRVRLLKTYAGVIRGLNAPAQIEIRVDGARVGQFTIGGDGAPTDDADDKLQARVAVKAGLREVVATIVKSEGIKAEGLGPARVPIWNREGDVPSAELAISSMLVGGPYNGKVPQDSPSRRRVFVCHPASATEDAACASRILSTLARRAYRRRRVRYPPVCRPSRRRNRSRDEAGRAGRPGWRGR